MNSKPVALITGTSSGIGLSAAIFLARAGFHVVATMRDPKKSQPLMERAKSERLELEVSRVDVQDDASIKSCVADIMAKHGRIDLLLNNAGSGFVSSTEQTPLPVLQKIMDVDFFGVWRCTQAVLPHMRKAASGRIITVSSIGGLIGQPFNDAYCAAKFAVEGMMESLAPLAKCFGVHVSLIEPGPVNTEFVATVTKEAAQGITIDAYTPFQTRYINGSRQRFATVGQTGDDIAAVIVTAATEASPSLRYVTSDLMKGIAGRKYVDITGNSIIALTGAQLTAAP